MENGTSNEEDFFNRNSAIITTLFFTILPVFSFLLQHGGEIIPHAEFKLNSVMVLIICYFTSLAIAGITPLLVSILFYIFKLGYMLDLPQKNFYKLFIQNLLFAFVSGSIFSMMIYIFYHYEILWGGLIVPPIVVLIIFLIKKIPFIKEILNRRTVKTYWKGIIILQLISGVLFVGIDHFLKPQIYLPRIEWNGDCYSSKDNKAIVKIKGIHNVKDAKLTRGGINQIIPVKDYYVNSDTYLVIDFAADFVIEGNYIFTATIDEIPVEHTLLYVFDRSIEEKEEYIDKMLDKIDNIQKIPQDSEVKKQLGRIKKAYLNGNKKEIKRIFNELQGHLSPEAIGLLFKIAI